MANYLHLATGRYPVSQSQIRAENPNTSYPASFPVPEGYALVFDGPVPEYNPITQYVREVVPPPRRTNGTYYQKFEVIDLPAEQAAANQEAARRQAILITISVLEESVSPRRNREAILGSDNGWLASIESQIAALRAQL